MKLINGIHHISMKASSEEQYEQGVRFYHEILGLPIAKSWEAGVMIGTEAGKVELFRNGGEELPQGVIRHVAFAVDHADACAEAVTAAGYEVFDGPRDAVIPADPPYPIRVAFCYGPFGEQVEFFEERDPQIKAAAALETAHHSQQIAGYTNRPGSESAGTHTTGEAEGEELLKIENLCKAYPAFRLEQVSFSVRKGRIMGFIGRNGAGKTTTLKCAMNLVKPDSGSIRYFGMELAGNEKAIKQQIGFTSGGIDYFTKKKIKDIISVTRSFYDNWDDAAYKDYMARFHLDENKTPAELSDGMKVKLNLVIALSHHAKLLLLDEPTSGLDPVSRDEIMMIFEYLKEQGCAILFSTHVTSDLDKCADDITYIRNGKIIVSTTKERFISDNLHHGTNVEDIMICYEREQYQEDFRL